MNDPVPDPNPDQCKQVDLAMLEDKKRDGYFQRACRTALLDQVRRQNMTENQ